MKFLYPKGLKKAITFSYDDGIEQDKRLIEMFDHYQLKGTFNVSSGLLDEIEHWETEGVVVPRLKSDEVGRIYRDHEVACHGLTHPNISCVEWPEKVRQVVTDKANLETLINKTVDGMAYPFGGVDDEVVEIMKKVGLKYGRVVSHTHAFLLPTDFYRWQVTCHHNDERIFSLINDYKAKQDDELSVFYIWGHSYEFDVNQNWDHMKSVCEKIAFEKDTWYCTNLELIEYLLALKEVVIDEVTETITNLSMQTIWFVSHQRLVTLAPGESIVMS